MNIELILWVSIVGNLFDTILIYINLMHLFQKEYQTTLFIYTIFLNVINSIKNITKNISCNCSIADPELDLKSKIPLFKSSPIIQLHKKVFVKIINSNTSIYYPIDQISIFSLYDDSPRSISGARYQSACTYVL